MSYLPKTWGGEEFWGLLQCLEFPNLQGFCGLFSPLRSAIYGLLISMVCTLDGFIDDIQDFFA